jgi:copper oxidase (laccase) domain-containing protein
VDALLCDPGDLLAWLGPAIGPQVYEVGDDVAAAFAGELESAFRPHGDRWLLDLFAVARGILAAAGIESVFGGAICSYSDPDRFFSFRRDGITGRMATLIWLE